MQNLDKPAWARGPAPGSAESDAPSGLIDQILSFLKLPARTPYLFLDPSDERLHAYVDGVESALDFITPALKDVLNLPESAVHGKDCLHRGEVQKILGRVPR